LLLLIYSKTFEYNINTLNNNKNFIWTNNNNLLIIDFPNLNQNIIQKLDLYKFIWIENFNYSNINPIYYINVLITLNKKIIIYFILDDNKYKQYQEIFLLLNKFNILFVALIDKEFNNQEYVLSLGYNILNLSKLEINKDIIFQNNILRETGKSLFIFTNL